MDQALFVAVDDGSERAGQVGKRINGIEFAAFNERGNDRPILSPSIMAREERAFAIERNRPDGSLHSVVVDLDTTVI